ncbi:MAG: cell division protein FtsQ/DivIB [Pseudohongiella sp.]|nr:cell division protein FtsQ/DivIB [Pseudohongiella sp.]MDO9520886.1 cell division protein FtsQ/DivIB [Pseudohongiella sp.]MDP2128051.1 cell division protein FtsQ/DivIB [Pseudohongiella sp.]
MSDRKSGSFSAYSGARETPLDFAPIRAESRHAVRPEGKVTDEKAEPAKRRLRGWLVLLLALGLGGIAINQYRGILADYVAMITEQVPALNMTGFNFPEFNRPVINRPINTVRLESRLESVTEEEVRILLARYTESGFLGVDVQDLRNELEQNPWVARATVRRVWPDALVIRIEEEQPVARWGDNELLNAEGVVFAPPMRGTEMHLPALRGPNGSETMLMARYQELSVLLSGIDMKLESLGVNARGSWTAGIEGGLELKIGRDDVDERLQRFVRLYRGGLSEKLAEAQTVDLRYSNGISVSNKPAATSSVASR